MSSWTHILLAIVGLMLFVATYQWHSEQAKRIELEAEKRHLRSELFASNKLLFLCESEMQELYNVPGLGSEIDSILGRTAPTDTIFFHGQAVAGSFGGSSEVTEPDSGRYVIETYDTCISTANGEYADFVWGLDCDNIEILSETDSIWCFRCTRPQGKS